MQTADIIVVGAGVVGLTAALQLANAGLTVQVLDAAEPVSPLGKAPDLRVVALSRASQRVFESLGTWQTLEADRLQAYTRMQLWDQTGGGALAFDAQEVHQPDLGHIVEYKHLQYVLQTQCQQNALIQLHYQSPLEHLATEGQGVQVNGMDAKVLLAADGARSPTRQRLGIDSQKHRYEQTALVATVRTEKPHQRTAYQRFAPDGPLAFLPLADPHLSSIVWSTSPQKAQQLQACEPQAFNEALWVASDQSLGACTLESDRVNFALQAEHASRYVVPKVALIGDAAHTIHPLAGQGLNLGVADAACVAEKLIWARDKGVPLGDRRVLERYERQRRSANAGMQRLMTMIQRGFARQGPVSSSMRQWGMVGLEQVPWLKRRLVQFALGE